MVGAERRRLWEGRRGGAGEGREALEWAADALWFGDVLYRRVAAAGVRGHKWWSRGRRWREVVGNSLVWRGAGELAEELQGGWGQKKSGDVREVQ